MDRATGSVAGVGVSRVQSLPVRGLTRRWSLRGGNEREAGGEPLVARVLRARGVHAAEDIERFIKPKLTELANPALMPDIDLASERLLRAVKNGERIVIYGDYDVDGITATTILYHTLKLLSGGDASRLGTYVPHRIDEGYGLNSGAIEEIAADGASVIVSVDCGVTAVEPARRAREVGVDLIITDHHNPPATLGELPQAYAVVHPRRPDSAYPFGDLCGAGVAYKLAWRLGTMGTPNGRASEPMRQLLLELLSFAALGAIADVVPLIGENRVLTRFGLERIKHSGNIGLRALIEAAGLAGEKVDTMDVGFKLAPRLNASGRMAHAEQAVELFTTANAERAAEIAAFLENQNRQRRAVELEILSRATELAEAQGMTGDDRRAIVLACEGWHAGVVGIVCSRLVDRFGRPAILMNIHEGVAHGSGRSIDGFNLHGALQACSGLLQKFGGHDMAAGLTLAHANVNAFVEAFLEQANAAIRPEQLMRELVIDVEARLGDLTTESVTQLEAMAPFGRGNPSPAILVRDVVLASPPSPMGKTGDHLALTVRDIRQSGSVRMTRVVAWKWGEHRAKLMAGQKLDLVVRPAISTFSGRAMVEPELLDLAVR